MARITVATSHPPFSQGGHLVIANALVAALNDAGHKAALLLTPQNRFGRQAAAYTATWLTDVGLAHDGRPVVARSGMHAAYGVPRRHTMPSAPAVVKRGGVAWRTSVSQSSGLTGHFFRLHLRPWCPGRGHNQRIL